MKSYSRSQLTNDRLISVVKARLSLDHETTADLVADLAELDMRKLYVPAGYDCMRLYCVHELRMSEDVAYKRIRAARAARKFPAIYDALAGGSVHLAAVVLLAPHLTLQNVTELLAAATHKTKAAVELLVAERFPQADMPSLVQVVLVPVANPEPAVSAVVPSLEPNAEKPMEPLAPGPVVPSVPTDVAMRVVPLPAYPKFTPLSPGRFAIQYTMSQRAHEKLRHAQALLGHAVPSGDVETVMERALDALIASLEKQKFAAASEPRARRSAADGRYIPAEIRREVRVRDGGRCTFVSEHGKRCESRTRLEMDHVVPVACGGQTTTDNLRLLCRAHNQYEAECALGAEFMRGKREEAQNWAAKANAQAKPEAKANANAKSQAGAEIVRPAAPDRSHAPAVGVS